MNHTPNYQLSQWEASDPVQRTDFNADNAKLDAALQALAGRTDTLEQMIPSLITVGEYEGDPAETRTIQLPFAPKMLVLFGKAAGKHAIAILIHGVCHLTLGDTISPYDAMFVPHLNGSVLSLRLWFSEDDAYYIAFR